MVVLCGFTNLAVSMVVAGRLETAVVAGSLVTASPPDVEIHVVRRKTMEEMAARSSTQRRREFGMVVLAIAGFRCVAGPALDQRGTGSMAGEELARNS